MAITQTDISGSSLISPETTTDKLVLTSLNVPSTPSSTGTEGQLEWDADFMYLCIAENVWSRTAHSIDWI